MLAIVHEAGWPIWLLIATSFAALTLIVERLLALRKRRIVPPRLLDEVLTLVRKRHITAEVVDKLEANSPLGRVLAAGLRNRNRPPAALKDALEQAGSAAAHRLNRYVGAIGTIAAIAPLMGLFGTVIGMIDIFASYSPGGNDPAQLAHGISMALYNTGLGIFIAIPTMIFYRYFRARIDDCLHEMEQAASRLASLLHPD